MRPFVLGGETTDLLYFFFSLSLLLVEMERVHSMKIQAFAVVFQYTKIV